MATSGDPPLSDYDQTMALFLEFLQELRNWRKVVDLQHDGVTVFRCTFTFAQLMQPSIDMDIVRVDSFDELPDRSVQPGAAAFALSSSAPSGGPAAAPGGGWDETALSAPCGGAEFPAMAGSPDRDPDWDDTRVRMPGPPFLSPFGWKRALDYRAIWGDADGNAPDPAETGPRPRMAFGRPWLKRNTRPYPIMTRPWRCFSNSSRNCGIGARWSICNMTASPSSAAPSPLPS